jgi:hypothetical protein
MDEDRGGQVFGDGAKCFDFVPSQAFRRNRQAAVGQPGRLCANALAFR